MFDALRNLAEARGWKLDPPNPGALNIYSVVTVTGSEGGVPVRLERVGGAQSFTTVAFLVPPLPIHFAITHEGLVGTLKNLVGFKDVQIGDAAFDKKFRVVCKDEEAIRRLLTPTLRACLERLYSQTNPLGLRGFHVSEEGVSLSRITDPGAMTAEAVVADIPITVEVVNALRAAG